MGWFYDKFMQFLPKYISVRSVFPITNKTIVNSPSDFHYAVLTAVNLKGYFHHSFAKWKNDVNEMALTRQKP